MNVARLLTKDEVLGLLRQKQGQREQKALARELGVSAQYLSDVLGGHREPGDLILAPLGLVKITMYEGRGKA